MWVWRFVQLLYSIFALSRRLFMPVNIHICSGLSRFLFLCGMFKCAWVCVKRTLCLSARLCSTNSPAVWWQLSTPEVKAVRRPPFGPTSSRRATTNSLFKKKNDAWIILESTHCPIFMNSWSFMAQNNKNGFVLSKKVTVDDYEYHLWHFVTLKQETKHLMRCRGWRSVDVLSYFEKTATLTT